MTTQPSESLHLQIFARFYLLCILLSSSYFDLSPVTYIPLIALAYCSFFLPRNLPLFIGVCAAQAAACLFTLPAISNHIFIQMFTSLYLLSAYLYLVVREHRPPTAESFFMLIRPAMMTIASIGYFFAAFNKLNTDYFDPEVSCAGVITQNILTDFKATTAALPNFLKQFFIWGSVLVELVALPLLYFRRTTKFMVLFLVIMHLFLSIQFIAISCFFLALLVCFMDSEPLARTELKLRQKLTSLSLPWRYGVFLFILIGFSYRRDIFFNLSFPYRVLGYYCLFFLPFAAYVIYVFAYGMLAHANLKPMGHKFVFRRFGLFPVVLTVLICSLVILSSTGPYLGFKTTTAMAMYSNLQMSPRSNHFLFKKNSWRIFNELDNLQFIKVRDLPRREFERLNKQSPIQSGIYLLPKYEIGRIFSRLKPDELELLADRGYNRNLIRDIKADYLSSPLYKKLFFVYAPILPSSKAICTW